MKVLIVSDTHGVHGDLEEVLERHRDIDMFIHLGDFEGGEEYVRALVDCPVHMVGGNNDFFSDLPREEEFVIAGHKVFITHGSGYFVSLGESRLKEEAKLRGADIVMYGHTHRPSLTEEPGLTILNPGSIAYPRQIGRQATYMIMEADARGEVHFQLNYV